MSLRTVLSRVAKSKAVMLPGASSTRQTRTTSKDGLQSAISDFNEYTTVKLCQYEQYAGFTEAKEASLRNVIKLTFYTYKDYYLVAIAKVRGQRR